MATVKAVWMFADSSGTGWQEVHYWDSESATPSLNDRITSMVDIIGVRRALLLGRDCSLVGVRASYRRELAIASLNKRVFLPGETSQPGVNEALSLAVKWSDSTNTRSKVTHLRGFWDSVEFDGNYRPDAAEAVGWQARFDDWKQALVTGAYGWLSKSPLTSAAGTVTNYTPLVSGRVTFTLGGAGMPVATVGTNQTLRMSRLNNGRSPLNESIVVEVTGVNSVTSIEQIAAGPFVSPGRFNFRSTAFARYNQVYSVSAGRRAQGRPFNRLPGRQKAKARY